MLWDISPVILIARTLIRLRADNLQYILTVLWSWKFSSFITIDRIVRFPLRINIS